MTFHFRPLLFIAAALLVLLGLFRLAEAALARSAGAEPRPVTRIETDEQEGVIRFFVKGREVGRLDREGLTVEGNLAYGGLIRDTNAGGP